MFALTAMSAAPTKGKIAIATSNRFFMELLCRLFEGRQALYIKPACSNSKAAWGSSHNALL